MLADCQVAASPLLVLKARSHGILRRQLADIIDRHELPLGLPHGGHSVVCLLAEPEEDWLAVTPEPLVLRDYWRLLFHARVHVAVRSRLAAAGPAALRTRIGRLGQNLFNDARFVLARDRILVPGADDAEAYARFAASFLELHAFTPALLPRFFAMVEDPRPVLQVLAEDMDAEGLLRASRPAGAAPLDGQVPVDAAPEPDDEPLEDDPLPAGTRRSALPRRAARVAADGNYVRAAILYQRARRRPGRRSDPRLVRHNPYFPPFIDRLAATLRQEEDSPPAAGEWAAALAPVLARAADSWRNAESRLLYDLQKVSLDSQRGIYALDLPGWLFTLGRRPLRRPLPAQQMVRVSRHLRSALRRLGRCRLDAEPRRRLEGLLRSAVHRAEGRLRENLRPAIHEALDRSGLQPDHTVEQVARAKLVEEFLDGIVRRGFARMSDLRDTLSRNQLKLHDLSGGRGLLHGDQLLQVDRHLRKPLDGVYHPGEIYLRFFQHVSSLLFATRAGRLFTYYGLIPFGAAFVILEVLGRIIAMISAQRGHAVDPFDHPFYVVGLGLYLLAMVNIEPFRRVTLRAVKAGWKGLRWFLVDWPGWVVCRRIVQAILATRTWRALIRYGLKPMAVTFLAWWLLPKGIAPATGLATLLAIYGAAAVVLNSRHFRLAAHMVAHATVVFWARLANEVFVGLFRVIMRAFHILLERLERTLYTVDEWLRFRAGQGLAALLGKAVLGMVWGAVAYAVRFCVTLLVEPQINPIKHFPVVTVSHKLILPTVPFMASGLHSLGLGKAQATTYATTTAFVIPGVFGFLAWELKENWRLYAANRSRTLHPVRMGSHGETFARLLRPGFHSGTVPRIFARLRRIAQSESGRRQQAALRKQEEALHHVAEAVSRFLRRELADLLNRCPPWQDTPLSIGRVELAATRIRVALECPLRGPACLLAFEQHDGWIVAGIDEPGWTAGCSCTERELLGVALLGLYHLAGVNLVREQIESLFAPQPVSWALRNSTLVVWPGPQSDVPIRYSLKQRDPEPSCAPSAPVVPVSDSAVAGLLLSRQPLSWQVWQRLWDRPAEPADAELADLLRQGASVLPARPCNDAERPKALDQLVEEGQIGNAGC